MKKSRLTELAGLNESRSLELTPEEAKKLQYYLEMKIKEMQRSGDSFFAPEIKTFTDVLKKLVKLTRFNN